MAKGDHKINAYFAYFVILRNLSIRNKLPKMRNLFLTLSLVLIARIVQAEVPFDVLKESNETAADVEKQEAIEEQFRENIGAEGSLGVETFRIRMTGDFTLSYVFADAPDSFIVTYHLELDNTVRNKVDILNGSAKIAASVQGFLAKWPSGECALMINASEAPYEIVFNQDQEESAKVNLRFTGTILEQWQSNCEFKGEAGTKFTTTGNPEKWIDRALKVAAREYTNLTIPVDRYHKKTSKHDFELQSLILADPPLGSAEIGGKGTIELIPEG